VPTSPVAPTTATFILFSFWFKNQKAFRLRKACQAFYMITYTNAANLPSGMFFGAFCMFGIHHCGGKDNRAVLFAKKNSWIFYSNTNTYLSVIS
jgi:hypothetical protein